MKERLPPYREFLCSDSEGRELLRVSRSIAIVGASEARLAELVRPLRSFGYRVLVGEQCLEQEPVDLVLAAAPDLDLAALAQRASAAGARGFWLDAADPAAAHGAWKLGLKVVMGRDVVAEYRMHFDDAELGRP